MPAQSAQPGPSAALRRDLSLVLPGLRAYDGQPVEARIEGAAASVAEAVGRSAALLRESRAPAIVGVRALTIEGCREAVHLAEVLRAALFVDGKPPMAMAGHEPVMQTATLGHVLAAERIITVGVDEGDAVLRRLRDHGASIRVESDDLAAVVARRCVRDGFDGAKRVAVVIGAGVDARMVSQWHRLAVQVQRSTRLAVVQLPAADAANARGAAEVVTWQTGVAPGGGGVDFGDGSPRRCAAFASRAQRGGFDVVIDVDPCAEPAIGRAARVTIGPGADKNAAVSLRAPGLAAGLAARVMRFDGIVLWLCDDPAAAPPDPTAALLRQLREAVVAGGDL